MSEVVLLGLTLFNLTLLPQSIEWHNRARNHLLLNVQAQKVGILKVVVSDEPIIPSTYCHYFHTLLIPSQEHIPLETSSLT